MGQVPDTNTFAMTDVKTAQDLNIQVAFTNVNSGAPGQIVFQCSADPIAVGFEIGMLFSTSNAAYPDVYTIVSISATNIITEATINGDVSGTIRDEAPLDLVGLFANANNDGFDPAYVGDKTNLLNFRNYDHDFVPGIPIPATLEFFNNDDGWVLTNGASIGNGTLSLPNVGSKASIVLNQANNQQVIITYQSQVGNSGTLTQRYGPLSNTGSASPTSWTPSLQPPGSYTFELENLSGVQNFQFDITVAYV